LDHCSDRECTGDPVNPESKQRTLDVLRWGFIPYWAKDPEIAAWWEDPLFHRDGDNSPFVFAVSGRAGHSKEVTFFHAIHK
jgi:hypothetical protein